MYEAEAISPPDHFRTIAQLSTCLRFVDDVSKYPETAPQDVGPPSIVVCLPQTGISISYDLRCLDPKARASRKTAAGYQVFL